MPTPGSVNELGVRKGDWTELDHGSASMGPQPRGHDFGILVGRKYRIEDLLDRAVADHERHALEVDRRFRWIRFKVERRQSKRSCEDQFAVAQQRKRQVQPRDDLLLIRGRLGAQAEDART